MPDDPMSLAELMVLSRLKTGVKYWIDGATDMPEYIFSGGIKRMAQEILNHRWALEQDEKCRAALESLWSVVKIRRHMDQTQGEHQENYTGEQFVEADEMLDQAIGVLDDLTPDAQK